MTANELENLALARLRTIAATLGPERCADALEAFAAGDTLTGLGWRGCALARAYGAPNRLVEDFDAYDASVPAAAWGAFPILAFAAQRLGLADDAARLVVRCFDGGPYGRNLLYEALAEEAAKLQTAPAVPEVPVEAAV